MARIDVCAANRERQKAAKFAAEAKELRQVANHLEQEAEAHLKEADALVGVSGRRAPGDR
jgi:hypothetical protein